MYVTYEKSSTAKNFIIAPQEQFAPSFLRVYAVVKFYHKALLLWSYFFQAVPFEDLRIKAISEICEM